MQQGLLFVPVVTEGVNGTQGVPAMFVSVRVHNGKLAISSPLLAHTAPSVRLSAHAEVYADAAGAVAQLRVSGEVHVDADAEVTSA